MGIRGLSTFINDNPSFFKPYKLHDSHVVIDGDNLIHALYFTNKINVICGGDYNKYAESVRKYFLVFLECNISPIVVFDGGYDKSGRKLKTIFERTNDRLSLVTYIARNKSYHEQVLPILSRDTFMCILNDLHIPFVMCDYEADDQITVLANYYKCPVISADSDFYIFDLHNGFITRDSIETTVIFDIDCHGKEYKFLNCCIYHIDEFVSHFPGIEKNVLPLFGTLMGNDYVEASEFENFFGNIHLPKYKGKHIRVHIKQRKMIGLLCWLRNNTFNEAVNLIMQYLKKERREYIQSVIENAVKSYELHNCNLLYIINKKLYNSELEFNFDSRLITPCQTPLPLYFITRYHSGHYSPFFANVIVLHKVFLNPQIDDLSCSSSYVCARYIRRVIYGILIRHNVGDQCCQNEKCLAVIEEYDREKAHLQKEFAEPIFLLEGIKMLPKINDLDSLKKEESRLILMKVLGVNPDFIINLPEEWQLLLPCINYWLCNSFPHSTEAFFYALIINLIYFSIIKGNNPYKYSSKCCTKNSAKMEYACSSVTCILSRINQSELQNAARNLKKYLIKPSINHGNPLRLAILHSYSQLQSCILSTISLNKLLGECMKNPYIHQCFNGTLLYNLTKTISTRSRPKLFVAEILGRETTLFALFKILDSKICYAIPSHCILKNQLSSQKTKRKHSNQFDTSKKNVDFVINKFDLLNCDSDCDIVI